MRKGFSDLGRILYLPDILSPMDDPRRDPKNLCAFGCVRIEWQSFRYSTQDELIGVSCASLLFAARACVFTHRYRYVIFSPGLITGIPFSSSLIDPSVNDSPLLNVKMACMCRNVIGNDAASRRSVLKTSWKWVAARILGQDAPRSRRCFKTPQKRPAPSSYQCQWRPRSWPESD